MRAATAKGRVALKSLDGPVEIREGEAGVFARIVPGECLLFLDDECYDVDWLEFARAIAERGGLPVLISPDPTEAFDLFLLFRPIGVLLDVGRGARNLWAGPNWLSWVEGVPDATCRVYPFTQYELTREVLSRLSESRLVRSIMSKSDDILGTIDHVLTDLDLDKREVVEFYIVGLSESAESVTVALPSWDPSERIEVDVDGPSFDIAPEEFWKAVLGDDGEFMPLLVRGRARMDATNRHELRPLLQKVVGSLPRLTERFEWLDYND